MKKVELQKLIREEIDNAIQEIDIVRHQDADTNSSLDLLRNLIANNSQFRYAMATTYRNPKEPERHTINNLDDEKETPIKQPIIDVIKKYSIGSQGNLYVTKTKEYSYIAHHLWNLDATMQTALVGVIKTTPSKGPYSMKTMFGIDSHVVHWSNVADEYKGGGFGKFLYDTLLYHYGVLESDTTLFEGSFNMWTKHFPKVAKYMGATIETDWGRGGTQANAQQIVIPIINDLKDVNYLRKLGSIIAFHSVIPAEVKKVAKFAQGLSYNKGTLGIVYINVKMLKYIISTEDDYSDRDSFLDILDSGISYDEMISLIKDDIEDTYPFTIDKSKKLIILFSDATMLIEPKGNEVKYDIL
jgi:hypothetical protein